MEIDLLTRIEVNRRIQAEIRYIAARVKNGLPVDATAIVLDALTQLGEEMEYRILFSHDPEK